MAKIKRCLASSCCSLCYSPCGKQKGKALSEASDSKRSSQSWYPDKLKQEGVEKIDTFYFFHSTVEVVRQKKGLLQQVCCDSPFYVEVV